MKGAGFDRDAVRQWLRILHGDCPGRIHVAATGAWAGPSYPTTDIDAAIDRVEQLDAGRPLGIYARMTTLRGALGRGERGGAADSLALPALWADLDIAGPAHKDQALPPDRVAVEAIVDDSGLPVPTFWIDSGYGFYPIWLLSQPHVVGDDLPDVADLSANWQRAVGLASYRLGWHYGQGVGDLARVLRIPGTVNRKAGGERPCRIIAATGVRYDLATLYERCADALAMAESEASGDLGGDRSYGETPYRGAGGTNPGEASPVDDWATRTSWADILQPHGWRLIRTLNGVGYWCRPGKAGGISATTNATGTDRLRVFTTSTDFDTTSYSKHGALAVLEHGGATPAGLSAAAAELRRRGFGADRDTAVTEWLSGLSEVMPDMGRTPPAPTGPAPADPATDAEVLREQKFRQLVEAEMFRQRINREARKQLDLAEFSATWQEPPSNPTLTDDLAESDEPLNFRIRNLLTVDGNAVLIAAFKAGKTTMCNNLLYCLADGEPFLGRFDVTIPDGRIGVFNYEVSPGQYRSWLRRMDIKNTDRISVLNLRGRRLPLTNPEVENWCVRWLIAREIRIWIVDPFARAMNGCGDENSNADVGAVLDALDVIKRRAGVRELIIPTHTGRGEQEPGMEHARGATRLDDWADSRWLLTVDDQGRRFFRAHGRDIEVDEELVSMDAGTGRLTMGGHDRRGMARKDRQAEIVEWVREHPGLGTNEIATQFGGQRNATLARVKAAIASRDLYVVPAGGRKILHYASPAMINNGGPDHA